MTPTPETPPAAVLPPAAMREVAEWHELRESTGRRALGFWNRLPSAPEVSRWGWMIDGIFGRTPEKVAADGYRYEGPVPTVADLRRIGSALGCPATPDAIVSGIEEEQAVRARYSKASHERGDALTACAAALGCEVSAAAVVGAVKEASNMTISLLGDLSERDNTIRRLKHDLNRVMEVMVAGGDPTGMVEHVDPDVAINVLRRQRAKAADSLGQAAGDALSLKLEILGGEDVAGSADNASAAFAIDVLRRERLAALEAGASRHGRVAAAIMAARVASMRVWLLAAAGVFAEYAEHHARKRDEAGATKAGANRAWADLLRRAAGLDN